MESKELIFNLLKKIDSNEIKYHFDGKNVWIMIRSEERIRIKLDELTIDKKGYVIESQAEEADHSSVKIDEWNKEFKENFYKEKGLDKCWVKDCPNKIYQTENDYKKVRVQCKDKHTRMVCLEHSKDYEEK